MNWFDSQDKRTMHRLFSVILPRVVVQEDHNAIFCRYVVLNLDKSVDAASVYELLSAEEIASQRVHAFFDQTPGSSF